MNVIKSGLSSDAIEKLRNVFSKHPEVERVVLYGSRAMGTHKPGSDIDLTIISGAMSTSQLLQIEAEIDDSLLPYKVDLSLLSQIDNPALLDHIQRVGLTLFSRSDARRI